MQVDRVGSMLGMYFTDQTVYDFENAKTRDMQRFAAYKKGMVTRGIYLAPSQFEATFVHAIHTAADIDETINAAAEIFETL